MGEKDMSHREGLAAGAAEPSPRDEGDGPKPHPRRMEPGKIYVGTDASGKVLWTSHVKSDQGEGDPTQLVPVPAEKSHKVHVLDLTPELQGLKTAEELHKAVHKRIHGL